MISDENKNVLVFYTQKDLLRFEPTEENLSRRYNREESIKKLKKLNN